MSKLLRMASVSLVLLGALLVQPAPGADKEKKLESKKSTMKSAAGIDFVKELGLDFDALKNLGARIDQAWSVCDPVGLSAAARDLMVAEKVAGKSAAVKAADLAKEATKMALERNRPSELKAVAMNLDDAGAKKELTDKAAATEKEIAKRKDGEKDRAILGTLSIINTTEYYVTIYVDYTSVGVIRPYSTGSVFVVDRRQTRPGDEPRGNR